MARKSEEAGCCLPKAVEFLADLSEEETAAHSPVVLLKRDGGGYVRYWREGGQVLCRDADSAGGAADGKPEADAGDRVESVYLITQPGAQRASAKRLLELCRGHWKIENLNQRERDCRHGEDACLMRTGKGQTNRAALGNMALAVIFHSRDPDKDKHLADTRVRLQMERDQAIRALTEP